MKTKKPKTLHRCRDCAHETTAWRGKCPACGAWQTLEEVTSWTAGRGSGRAFAGVAASASARLLESAARHSDRRANVRPAILPEDADRPPLPELDGGGLAGDARPRRRGPIGGDRLASRARALEVAFLGEVEAIAAAERLPVGLREVDRVLGGGLVPGAAAILGGDPGIGKSTLVLQLAYAVAALGKRVLYVAGEEHPAQLRLRAERLGFLPAAGERAPVLVLGTVELEKVLDALELAPDLVVIDSMQVLRIAGSDAAPGSVSQVRDVAHLLVEICRARGASLLLVGHVTKEGTLAGPRVVEHLVDQVLSLEGDGGGSLRLLRSSKNRFGDATETGVLEMTAQGLVDIENPSAAFLRGRAVGMPGSVVLPTREGSRSYLVEVQALATERAFASPVRRVTGLDAGRAAQVVAVLEKRAGLAFREQDLFLSLTAGAKVREPASDVAVAVACASSLLSRATPDDTVYFGEIGLGGELRAVPGTKGRLLEAQRLGFTRAVGPAVEPSEVPEGLSLVPAARIDEVVQALLRR